MIELFYKHKASCPWNDINECTGTTNTSRDELGQEVVEITECEYYNCPIVHWIEIAEEAKKNA